MINAWFVNLHVFFNVMCYCKKRSGVCLCGASWNSLFQVLVSPIFSHLFKIIVCLLLNLFHALCNHSQICGFKLLILKSTLRLLPFLIYYLMTPNVELHLECMFKWHCKLTLIGCKTMVQFVGTKTTKIFGFFLLSSPKILDFCVDSSNLITKIVVDVFEVPITQFD